MAGQLPVHIACQRGKKVQLGQMLFFVQHSLVQVGNAPALGDVASRTRRRSAPRPLAPVMVLRQVRNGTSSSPLASKAGSRASWRKCQCSPPWSGCSRIFAVHQRQGQRKHFAGPARPVPVGRSRCRCAAGFPRYNPPVPAGYAPADQHCLMRVEPNSMPRAVFSGTKLDILQDSFLASGMPYFLFVSTSKVCPGKIDLFA